MQISPMKHIVCRVEVSELRCKISSRVAHAPCHTFLCSTFSAAHSLQHIFLPKIPLLTTPKMIQNALKKAKKEEKTRQIPTNSITFADTSDMSTRILYNIISTKTEYNTENYINFDRYRLTATQEQSFNATFSPFLKGLLQYKAHADFNHLLDFFQRIFYIQDYNKEELLFSILPFPEYHYQIRQLAINTFLSGYSTYSCNYFATLAFKNVYFFDFLLEYFSFYSVTKHFLQNVINEMVKLDYNENVIDRLFILLQELTVNDPEILTRVFSKLDRKYEFTEEFYALERSVNGEIKRDTQNDSRRDNAYDFKDIDNDQKRFGLNSVMTYGNADCNTQLLGCGDEECMYENLSLNERLKALKNNKVKISEVLPLMSLTELESVKQKIETFEDCTFLEYKNANNILKVLDKNFIQKNIRKILKSVLSKKDFDFSELIEYLSEEDLRVELKEEEFINYIALVDKYNQRCVSESFNVKEFFMSKFYINEITVKFLLQRFTFFEEELVILHDFIKQNRILYLFLIDYLIRKIKERDFGYYVFLNEVLNEIWNEPEEYHMDLYEVLVDNKVDCTMLDKNIREAVLRMRVNAKYATVYSYILKKDINLMKMINANMNVKEDEDLRVADVENSIFDTFYSIVNFGEVFLPIRRYNKEEIEELKMNYTGIKNALLKHSSFDEHYIESCNLNEWHGGEIEPSSYTLDTPNTNTSIAHSCNTHSCTTHSCNTYACNTYLCNTHVSSTLSCTTHSCSTHSCSTVNSKVCVWYLLQLIENEYKVEEITEIILNNKQIFYNLLNFSNNKVANTILYEGITKHKEVLVEITKMINKKPELLIFSFYSIFEEYKNEMKINNILPAILNTKGHKIDSIVDHSVKNNLYDLTNINEIIKHCSIESCILLIRRHKNILLIHLKEILLKITDTHISSNLGTMECLIVQECHERKNTLESLLADEFLVLNSFEVIKTIFSMQNNEFLNELLKSYITKIDSKNIKQIVKLYKSFINKNTPSVIIAPFVIFCSKYKYNRTEVHKILSIYDFDALLSIFIQVLPVSTFYFDFYTQNCFDQICDNAKALKCLEIYYSKMSDDNASECGASECDANCATLFNLALKDKKYEKCFFAMLKAVKNEEILQESNKKMLKEILDNKNFVCFDFLEKCYKKIEKYKICIQNSISFFSLFLDNKNEIIKEKTKKLLRKIEKYSGVCVDDYFI